MAATPDKVRQARAFLFGRGLQASDIPPRRFANAATELNLSFTQLLMFMQRLYSGGQGQSTFRLDDIRAAAAAEAKSQK